MRVLIAPIEIAGQMASTAKALRKVGIKAISCNYSYNKNPFGYTCDINLGPDEKRPILVRKIFQLFFICSAVFRFDVFHFNFGKTLLSKNRDLALLKRLGKKMVVEFWGDDVRTDNHRELGPNSNLQKAGHHKIIKKLKRLGRDIDVALVADLELRAYVEPYFKKIEMVPQRIELEGYIPKYPDPAKKRPLIVHAPTQRTVKGTSYVIDAVEALKPEYPFDFRLIEGMKHAEARKLYKTADVVVDQLLIGTYGVFALESMALGKPVITYINDETKNSYPPSLPILSASQKTIQNVLERVIRSGKLRHDLGFQSRKYVEDYHDSIKVAERLRSIYQSL